MRVFDLIVQCLDKTCHIFSQVSNYGYLNSTILIVMVTATINANSLWTSYILFNTHDMTDCQMISFFPLVHFIFVIFCFDRQGRTGAPKMLISVCSCSSSFVKLSIFIFLAKRISRSLVSFVLDRRHLCQNFGFFY